MRVVALPADETGCGSYRVIWPAATVANNHPDWQVDIYRPSDVKIAAPGGRLAAIQGLDPEGIDVAVMQRIGTPGQLALMRWLQEQGTAVVLDADDALWTIHRENVAYKAWNSAHQHWRWMDAAAAEADLVTVTTRRLADRYGRHGRVEILPNRVPVGVTEIPRRTPPDAPLRFGWPGYVGTHPTDLHAVGNAAARLMIDTSVHCLIVGNGQGIISAWGLQDQTERVAATGPLPIERYFEALTALDVGVVPLEDSLFNRCKSGLKAAELAAAGVPSVVSPTPAHTQLAREGYPLLTAESGREWYDQVHRLIADPDRRAELATCSREAAVRHSLENHAEEWAAAWQRAISRRVKLSRAAG